MLPKPTKPARPQRPRIYVDSNIFLTLFNGGKDSDDGAERLVVVKALLQDAENGKIELFTSELTILECPKSRFLPESWTGERIALFFENAWIVTVEADRDVILLARDLQAKAPLKAMDALQVASAMMVENLDTFFSYDGKDILKHAPAVMAPVEVCKPHISWTTIPLDFKGSVRGEHMPKRRAFGWEDE